MRPFFLNNGMKVWHICWLSDTVISNYSPWAYIQSPSVVCVQGRLDIGRRMLPALLIKMSILYDVSGLFSQSH